MKIVLIGYRGTGKSAVGQQVARMLGLEYVGMDAAIEAAAGRSIPEIVAEYGWERFRDLESEQARKLCLLENVLIDTGGGVIERPQNMALLSVSACVIWLQASVEVIVGRIAKETQRPALTQGKTFTQEVAEVLSRRIEKYRAAAQYCIDTDHLSIDDIAGRVAAIWREKKSGDAAKSTIG